MRVPTVRVKHPSGDGFMIINVSDLTDQHEMLPIDEQDDLFDPSVLQRQPAGMDPALRDLAAEFCLEIIGDKFEAEGRPFASLSPADQLSALQEARGGYVAQRDKYRAMAQEDLEERLRLEASQTPPPEATDTPDTILDTPREDEGAQSGQSGAQDDGQGTGQSGQPADTDQGDEKSEEPELPELRIEASRGYYYVWAGDEKVSKGHREIADARSDLADLVAEGKGRAKQEQAS